MTWYTEADTPESTNGNNKREGAAPAKPSKAKKQKVGKGVSGQWRLGATSLKEIKAANGKPLTFQAADLEGFATASRLVSLHSSLTYI